MDQLAYDQAPTRRRNRRRVLVAMLLVSSLATVGAGAMSLAVFTDSKASDGSWSTGTIALGIDQAVVFDAADILPGDSGSQTLVVSNTGTGDLRYAMTSLSDNADGKGLADQMTLSITNAACGDTGTSLYSGALSGAKFGDPAQGADTGDQDVAASASQSLCFSWSFPLASGNGYKNAATSTTFTFDAEQTAHN